MSKKRITSEEATAKSSRKFENTGFNKYQNVDFLFLMFKKTAFCLLRTRNFALS